MKYCQSTQIHNCSFSSISSIYLMNYWIKSSFRVLSVLLQAVKVYKNWALQKSQVKATTWTNQAGRPLPPIGLPYYSFQLKQFSEEAW